MIMLFVDIMLQLNSLDADKDDTNMDFVATYVEQQHNFQLQLIILNQLQFVVSM
jgi:hypothetical protein